MHLSSHSNAQMTAKSLKSLVCTFVIFCAVIKLKYKQLFVHSPSGRIICCKLKISADSDKLNDITKLITKEFGVPVQGSAIVVQ